MHERTMPFSQLPLPPARTGLACALLSAHVLLAELALTRLLSATLYYHYAFAVVTLALVGVGWGARGWRAPESAERRRAAVLDACSAAATALLICTILLLVVPWRPYVRAAGELPAEGVTGLARWLHLAGRWTPPGQLVLLVILAGAPFVFAGRGLASLFAASRGRAAGLKGAEAAGGALGGLAAAAAIYGLGAPGALLAASCLAAAAGACLAGPAEEEPAGSRRRAVILGGAAALVALLAAAGALLQFPPLWGLSRFRFGLRQAAGPLFIAGLALVVELLGTLPRARRGVRAFLQSSGIAALLLIQGISPILRVQYVKGGYVEASPLREAWTLDARAVLQPGNLYTDGPGKVNFGWGPSRTQLGPVVDQMQIQVDGLSASPMVRFRGNLDEVVHLRYDITSLPFHRLEPGADILVIGAGGGRDLLAALLFDPRRVTGVEVNPRIVRWVCEDYASFTGQLCANSKVRVETAEARAWLARSRDRFDLIQVAFADTWAAAPAGAYALPESFLYTREAFRAYLDHLNEGGVVSFSHYRATPQAPTIERLFLTAVEALEEAGARDPGAHLFLAATPEARSSVATLLVRRQPFPTEELKKLVQATSEQGFLILHPGGGKLGEAYRALLPLDGRARQVGARPFDIRPVDDDRPFFFLTARWIRRSEKEASNPLDFHDNAAALVVPVGVAGTLAAVAGALARRRQRRSSARAAGLAPAGRGMARGFFLLAGFSFVAAEVGILQRASLVLGGPGTALTVALTALLSASAAGAALAQSAPRERSRGWVRLSAAASATILVGIAVVLPWMTSRGQGLPLAVRLVAILAVLVPAGMCLGILGASALRIMEQAGEGALASAWGTSALGAAMGGTAGWSIGIALGYSAVLLVAAAAAAGTIALVAGLGSGGGELSARSGGSSAFEAALRE